MQPGRGGNVLRRRAAPSTCSWLRPRWAASTRTRPSRPTSRASTLLIQTNVLDAAFRHGAQKFLFLGSSCMYPRLAPQPMRVPDLMTGPVEPTNEWYGPGQAGRVEDGPGLPAPARVQDHRGPSRPTSTARGTISTPRDSPRGPGADPALPRGQGARGRRSLGLGHGLGPAGIPVRGRRGRRPGLSHGALRRPGDHQRGRGPGDEHPGADRGRGQGGGIHRPHRVGRQQARRHAPQAAGRGGHGGAGLQGPDQPGGGIGPDLRGGFWKTRTGCASRAAACENSPER